MYCRFEAKAQRGSGPTTTCTRGTQAAPPAVIPPSSPDPMLALLERLMGRTVTVLAGGFLITGKVVSAHPVTLVGTTGVTTVITSPVKSVQF